MKVRDEFRHLKSTLSRLRRSRGFGVHSPFAYTFITDVLIPTHYRYYDDNIRALHTRVRRDTCGAVIRLSQLRRLLRVAIARHPATYAILGPDPAALVATALSSALPEASPLSPGDDVPDMLIALPGSETPLRDSADVPPTIILTDMRDTATAALYASLRPCLIHTQTYTNDREAILISRPDFTPQTFRLWY